MAEVKVRFFYTVTAVVFGADETLLNIELVNGFKFLKPLQRNRSYIRILFF